MPRGLHGRSGTTGDSGSKFEKRRKPISQKLATRDHDIQVLFKKGDNGVLKAVEQKYR